MADCAFDLPWTSGCFYRRIARMPAADARACRASPPGPIARTVSRMPPTSFFLTSAVFHYLGPSLAVLLFAHVATLGVAWLRIASAAVVFALWRRPWRIFTAASPGQRLVFTGLGAVLAAMNVLFYLAIDRLPLATVGAIEFLGTVILAAAGARTRRNALALLLAVGGVAVLTSVQLAGQPLGYLFAFANCAGFMLYILLGHRIANAAVGGGGSPGLPLSGIDQLGLAMIIAAVVATPFGVVPAAPAFTHPAWLAWGIGVGVCSSVIPYVTDQLAMARLPRATFSLMLALLPATATVIGLIVLGQVPTARDLMGIGLVILGVALHRDPPRRGTPPAVPASAAGRDSEVAMAVVKAGHFCAPAAVAAYEVPAGSTSAAAGNRSRELSTSRGAPSPASRAPGS